MHDPFFLPPPPFLQNTVKPIAAQLGLTTLHLHIHELLFATTVYSFIYTVVSPLVSNTLFPDIYPKFPPRTRLNWDVHVVSLCQSLFINCAALWVMWVDEERRQMGWEERVWGYSGAGGMIQAFAAGYFLWDLGICFRNRSVFGLGLLAHAVAALVVFSFGFVSWSLVSCRFVVAVFLVWGFSIETCILLTANLVRCIAPVCQLLRPHFHPLRALLPIPQLSLVLRQTTHDRLPSPVAQRHDATLLILLLPPGLGHLSVYPRVPRRLGRATLHPLAHLAVHCRHP